METSKPALHEYENAVFQFRHEAGVQASLSWYYERQKEIGKQWPTLRGEELYWMQGEARLLARLIKLVEHGPAIKQAERGE